MSQAQEFIEWTPTQALVDQHVAWHTLPCSVNGQPLTGDATLGRRCTNTGEDFLIWHRAYIKRLRDDFEAKGLTFDITPWYSVPAEVRSSGIWSTALDADVAAMDTFINPNTGVRFASLNEFGSFIETTFHGSLHTGSSIVWGGTDPDIGQFTSPKSTLFFKIHGYIDFMLQRYLDGDFNWDGKSDLIVRNGATTQVWQMNDTAVTSKTTTTVTQSATDGCNWYVGATGDFNFDGHTDIVWHGPGCNKVRYWYMGTGATVLSTADLAATQGSGFTLIGSNDFNQDNRPDLAWRNNSTNDVSVWMMKGTTRIGSPATLDVPAGWQPILIGDLTINGPPDLLYRQVTGSTAQYAVQYMLVGNQLGTQFAIGGLPTDTTAVPNAIGRYHTTGVYSDLVFEQGTGATHNRWFSNLSTVVRGNASYSAPTATVALATNERIQGPR